MFLTRLQIWGYSSLTLKDQSDTPALLVDGSEGPPSTR